MPKTFKQKSKYLSKKVIQIRLIIIIIVILILSSYTSFIFGRQHEKISIDDNFKFLMNKCKYEYKSALYLYGDNEGVKGLGCVKLDNNIQLIHENNFIKTKPILIK